MATAVRSTSPSVAVIRGALAGLAGGVVFGVMMGMMGALPMVGMLVGQQNATVGFVVHMVISAIIGAIYGGIAVRLPQTVGTAIVAGALYGVVWWMLGALILMPLLLGMNNMIFVIGQMQIMSLVGHLVYGVVTGLAFLWLVQRG